VWLPDPDDFETLVCTATGERLPLAAALRCGPGHIVVRYVEDWRGHGSGS
jgi:hypothetical protein